MIDVEMVGSRYDPRAAPVWWISPVTDKVMLRCLCGGVGALDDSGHEIDELGAVSPSVNCPHCEFHEHIKLSDWPEGKRLRG